MHRHVSKEESTKRHKRWKRKGKFHSGVVTYPRNGNIPKLTKRCAKTITDQYMVDQLKGPMNNKPKPDSISRASNNYYFGQNHRHADNGNKGTIFRAAYAVGSGNRSIGLNPKTFVINQIFPDLASLVAEITKVIRLKTEWKNASFNQVSVKLYYTFFDEKGKPVRKFTNWHVDITSDSETGLPKSDNSQTPGTPVAILTFGDEKSLLFRRQYGHNDPVPGTEIEFPQSNGTLIMLDGRDERLDDDGSCWWHKSSHSQGVTFSFMFRNVQMYMEVDAITGRIVDEEWRNKREEWFADRDFWWTSEWYNEERWSIEENVQKLFK